jgi:hypothetical protein
LLNTNTSAKEYLLNLFMDYDIIILCERHHSEITQYELITDILKDPYFIDSVGHIYTEFGVANMDSVINKFLVSEIEDSAKIHNNISSIFRDCDYNPWWHCSSFPLLLKQIQKINRINENNIQLHPCDVKFNWNTCHTSEDYKEWDTWTNRDSLIYDNFIKKYKSINLRENRDKALIIMNYSHAFLSNMYNGNEFVSFFGNYVKRNFGSKARSVYIMGLGYPNNMNEYDLVQNGKWDYYFETYTNRNVGIDLSDSPFGNETFDAWPLSRNMDSLKYKDVFTDLIFYRSISDHKLSVGWNNYISEEFNDEFYRRFEICSEAKRLSITKDQLPKVIRYLNSTHETKYEKLDSLKEKIKKYGL